MPARFELLERIGRIAFRAKTRSFLVGGPVRDMLLGLSSPDLDIAVESGCRKVGTALAQDLNGRFVFHSRFLTGTVSPPASFSIPGSPLPPPQHIDICQTRTETYSRPAVLPAVKPAGIEADLARRDFSVNALAYELTPRAFGRIIDPCSGRVDIASRRLRVLHNQSFIDDPTRAFRAIRFAIRLGFDIEPATLAHMRTSIRLGHPGLLTPERILYELKLICSEPLVLPTIEAVLKEKLLDACWGQRPGPSLRPNLQRLVQARAEPYLLYIYLLSHLPVTPRFPLTRLERESAQAIRTFDPLRTRLHHARRPSTIYRLLHQLPRPTLQVLAVVEPKPVRSKLTRYLDVLSGTTTSVAGRTLRQLGLKPGPQYRAVLRRLLDARLDGRVRSPEQELALAEKLVRRLERP